MFLKVRGLPFIFLSGFTLTSNVDNFTRRMKLLNGALVLLVIVLCSCSTTPTRPIQVSPENAQAIQAIHEQEQFAWPLSFKDGVVMSGRDYANVTGSYTDALRKIDLSKAPLEFQTAFQNYIRAWDRMKALLATEPRKSFTTADQFPVAVPYPSRTRRTREEFEMFDTEFRHVNGLIQRAKKALKTWREAKG
ncbi:MAG: hypothetical protein JWM16_5773 [Verrucomicrobiales bacterium]|nr:hypothetical protein [Verrucomicrobiales bacterium]